MKRRIDAACDFSWIRVWRADLVSSGCCQAIAAVPSLREKYFEPVEFVPTDPRGAKTTHHVIGTTQAAPNVTEPTSQLIDLLHYGFTKGIGLNHHHKACIVLVYHERWDNRADGCCLGVTMRALYELGVVNIAGIVLLLDDDVNNGSNAHTKNATPSNGVVDNKPSKTTDDDLIAFNACARRVAHLRGISPANQLRLYGLYKVAMTGAGPTGKRPAEDSAEGAKYSSWEKAWAIHTTVEGARSAYLALVAQVEGGKEDATRLPEHTKKQARRVDNDEFMRMHGSVNEWENSSLESRGNDLKTFFDMIGLAHIPIFSAARPSCLDEDHGKPKQTAEEESSRMPPSPDMSISPEPSLAEQHLATVYAMAPPVGVSLVVCAPATVVTNFAVSQPHLFREKTARVVLMGGAVIVKEGEGINSEFEKTEHVEPDPEGRDTLGDPRAAVLLYKTAQDLSVPMIVLSRFLSQACAIPREFFDSCTHAGGVGKLIYEGQRDSVEELYRRASAPRNDTGARRGLPERCDGAWFAETFCADGVTVPASVEQVWKSIGSINVYASLGVLAALPLVVQRFLEVADGNNCLMIVATITAYSTHESSTNTVFSPVGVESSSPGDSCECAICGPPRHWSIKREIWHR